MSAITLINECCKGLSSTKITERKKCSNQLLDLLDDINVVTALNEGTSLTWDNVVLAVNTFLNKEVEKFVYTNKKRNSNGQPKPGIGDILLKVVQKGGARISVVVLIDLVVKCFTTSNLQRYCGDTYIVILLKNILIEQKYFGEITCENWIELFNLLKRLCTSTDHNIEERKYIQSLYLLVYWGPLHSLPSSVLRQQFDFFTNLCVNIQSSTSRIIQEHILKILIQFCKHTAKDCCLSCCKLGENVMTKVLTFYASDTTDDTVKLLLFEFLHLQVNVHHPGGVYEGNSAACAYCWNEWNKHLRAIYFILHSEIDAHVGKNFKKSSFLYKDKKGVHLSGILTDLIINVCKQVFHNINIDVSQANVYFDNTQSISQPAYKRKRIEINIKSIIQLVQQTKDWPWLNFLSSFLKKYYNVITEEEFILLLQILSSFQVECEESEIRFYIYECLSTMVEIQNYVQNLNDLSTLTKYWIIIWDSAVRALGLNQNEKQVNNLLQKLILNTTSQQSIALFNIYLSGVVIITEHSMRTLDIACYTYTLPDEYMSGSQKTVSTKVVLVEWILYHITDNNYNAEALICNVTAKILASLMLKQWPKYLHTCDKTYSVIKNVSDNIEETCLVTAFEKELICDESNISHSEETSKTYITDSGILAKLYELTDDVVEKIFSSDMQQREVIKKYLCLIIMLANVTSYMIDYNIISKSELDNFKFITIIEDVLKKLDAIFYNRFLTINEKEIPFVKNILSLLENLFSNGINPDITQLIKRMFPIGLLHKLFAVIRDEEDINLETEHIVSTESLRELKRLCSSVLYSYCSVLGVGDAIQNQKFALQSLADLEFNSSVDYEYEEKILFLTSLHKYKPGTIEDEILISALKNICNICQFSCISNNTALNILNVLKGLMIHVAVSKNDVVKCKAINLLMPFYERRKNYSCQVSVALINHIKELIILDVEWPFKDCNLLINELPKFLCSEYQEVRFAAIKTLAVFYSIPCKNKDIYNQQKKYFECIIKMLAKVFEIEATLDQEISSPISVVNIERDTDEVVTRTSSVMHTYISIMLVSDMWREQALFYLILIVEEMNLNKELLMKALNLAAEKLNIANKTVLLELHLSYLIKSWYKIKLDLNSFPVYLLNIDNFNDFYLKYANIVIPFHIQFSDIKDLKLICEQNGQPINEIIELLYPKIIATCLPAFVADRREDITENELKVKKRVYKNLVDTLGVEKMSALLSSKIDQVLIQLNSLVSDKEHFESLFETDYVLLEPNQQNISVDVFMETIKYMEKKISKGENLLQYCILNSPEKIQNIILSLTMNVYESPTVEHKLQEFHRYAIIINMIISHLNITTNLQDYLIRDICFTLLNFVMTDDMKCKIDSSERKLSIIAAKYLKSVLLHILPNCAEVLKNILPVLVSKLTVLAKYDNEIGSICIGVLNFIVDDCAWCLSSAIEILDPFPSDEKFTAVQNVYMKYRNEDKSLEFQIKHFLNAGNLMGNVGCRLEGLKHLKTMLANKKDELKVLYSNLYTLRGFSEDCEESLLHQLLCMLVKLTRSDDTAESLQATRCLGELGAANLTTLVLQTESIYDGLYCKNVVELMTGRVVSHLLNYIVESDPILIQASSNSLYKILLCKEGTTVVDSNKNYGHGIIYKPYLIPFLPRIKTKASLLNLISQLLTEIDCDELWCPEKFCAHEKWITDLVCALLKCFTENIYLNHLIPVCTRKVSLCEELLPFLIYIILNSNNKNYSQVINSKLNTFFKKHWNFAVTINNEKKGNICVNKFSAQCMLNVVNFVRLQENLCSNKRRTSSLHFNYLEIAFVAQFCGAHFTSLLYAELWCQEKISELDLHNPNTSISFTKLELIFQNQDIIIVETLGNILKEAYKSIGDFDALQGRGLSHLLDAKCQIEHYIHRRRWMDLMQFFEVEVACGKTESQAGLMDAFKNSSLYQLPLMFNNIPADYECLWRLGQWDKNINSTKIVNDKDDFEKLRYITLKSIIQNDEYTFVNTLTNARQFIINDLRHVNLESSKNLYSYLSKLQSLQEIEDFATAKSIGNFTNVFEKWRQQDKINRNDFEYIEPIKAQRITIIRGLQSAIQGYSSEELVQFSLDLINMARLEGFMSVANRSLMCLTNLNITNPETKARILFEKVQLLWLMNDKYHAQYLLRDLMNTKECSPRLHCLAMKLYGTWMIETHSENPQAISDYFLKSLEISTSLDRTEKIRNETANVLAKFADKKYQQVLSYIKSWEFEKKVENMRKSKKMALDLKKQPSQTEDIRRAFITHQRQCLIDENEIKNTYKEKNVYLNISVKYYLYNLQYSDIHNENIFRILSLWLENRSDIKLHVFLQNSLPEVASYKFIRILPQLVPHLTDNSEDNFGKEISLIVERCATNHPHHTLPVVLALVNAHKDRKYSTSVINKSSNETRVRGAITLIEKIKNKSIPFENLIKKWNELSDALIELAYHKEQKSSSENIKVFPIPERFKLRKIKNYDNVLVPTYNLPINESANYTNIIGIHRFDKKYNTVGGINAPKCITCIGSDGLCRSQLVKGQDDLRQDAVMQQVFTIINGLLAGNKQSNKLLIRTYKIVPLSMRSGILEWVENTITLGEYLHEAHMKYNPLDYTPSKSKENFQGAAKKQSVEDKLRIYQDICKNMKPVLHKFFETLFPQATVWYERRRAYMHSVATSSMCGYILGLGDRHVQNILIDKTTAEVIHIDFGIAFEQGRILPTPETVPFRLTRDIEDGMGVSGIEGIFRSACEKTMEVLRQNGQTILTILEVLLYDPLYVWTVSSAEAFNRQQDESVDNMAVSFPEDENQTVNVTAERALLRLRNKLQGTEEGDVTGIECQVEKLLQEARDPVNLCRLFFGWKPYF